MINPFLKKKSIKLFSKIKKRELFFILSKPMTTIDLFFYFWEKFYPDIEAKRVNDNIKLIIVGILESGVQDLRNKGVVLTLPNGENVNIETVHEIKKQQRGEKCSTDLN